MYCEMLCNLIQKWVGMKLENSTKRLQAFFEKINKLVYKILQLKKSR